MTSRTREMTASKTPPAYPATTPTAVPRTQVSSAAVNPMNRLVRPPYSSRAMTSRPWLSAPRK
ncbi:hypothetical protein [Streptomyces griseorubiginosus]